jgi:hypothetical protein
LRDDLVVEPVGFVQFRVAPDLQLAFSGDLFEPSLHFLELRNPAAAGGISFIVAMAVADKDVVLKTMFESSPRHGD